MHLKISILIFSTLVCFILIDSCYYFLSFLLISSILESIHYFFFNHTVYRPLCRFYLKDKNFFFLYNTANNTNQVAVSLTSNAARKKKSLFLYSRLCNPPCKRYVFNRFSYTAKGITIKYQFCSQLQLTSYCDIPACNQVWESTTHEARHL